MPRPRFHKLPAQRQQRILQAAAQAFANLGFDKASLNHIVEDAGISKGSVYYYFDDKADLFATVLRDLWDRLFPTAELDVATLDADNFWPTIRRAYVQSLESVQQIPWIIGLGKAAYALPEDVLKGTVFGKQLAQLKALAGKLIEHGQRIGVVRNDLPASLLLAMLAGAGMASDRWMVDNWDALEPEEMTRVSLRLFDVFRQLMAPVEAPCDVPPGGEVPRA
ncbi:MAG: TetR/AcrR family transcriptional regulator [Myxococcota bacterium]